MAGPIGTKLGAHVQNHLGMDICQTYCPSRHKEALGGGLGGQTFKSLGKLPNGCTDWNQIWYTSADSSGNGHWLNTIRPSIPQGAFLGGLGGDKFKSLGKLSNGWTDWIQIWYTSADSSGYGRMLNTIRPSIPQGTFRGVLWGHKFKSGKAAKRLDQLAPNLVHVRCLWIHLGMDIGSKQFAPRYPTAEFWGALGGQHFK